MNTDLIPQEHVKILQDIVAYCQQENVVSIRISTDAELQAAGALGRELKFAERNIEAKRVIAKEPILENGRIIDAEYNRVKEIVKNRIDALASAIRKYQAEQEAIRLEAQRKADEEARRERARIEEAARIQREKESAALFAAEEARRKAQEAASEEERLKLQAEARKLEIAASNAAEKAFVKENIAETVVAPIVAEPAKVKGVSARDNWKWVGTDIIALAQYCIETDQCELLDFNGPNLTRKARSVQDKRAIPGIRIFNDQSTVFAGFRK